MDRPPRDVEADFWSHVEELAYRLRRIAIALVISSVVVSGLPVSIDPYVPAVKVVPNLILENLVPEQITFRGETYEIRLASFSPFAGFNILFKSTLLLGLLASSPFIAREIFAFIRPALYPHEEAVLKKMAAASTLLFMLGILVAYFVVIPLAFKALFLMTLIAAGEGELVAISDVERLFSMAIGIMVASGIMFEIPLVIYLLLSRGILEPRHFSGDNMKYALVASLILGAIISPDPTGMGMLMLGLPYYALLHVAVLVGKRSYRKRFGENKRVEAGEPAYPQTVAHR
ncbi:MAG: twin-arginine translocase subunit TatC [Desulfurococcales archaeon]|nr:twin-arginine translocase subunit TatC [Desulfurococcales archaeon]